MSLPKHLKYWVNTLPFASCALVITVKDLRDGEAFSDIVSALTNTNVNKNTLSETPGVRIRQVICSLADAIGWKAFPPELTDSRIANRIVDGEEEVCVALLQFLKLLWLNLGPTVTTTMNSNNNNANSVLDRESKFDVVGYSNTTRYSSDNTDKIVNKPNCSQSNSTRNSVNNENSIKSVDNYDNNTDTIVFEKDPIVEKTSKPRSTVVSTSSTVTRSNSSQRNRSKSPIDRLTNTVNSTVMKPSNKAKSPTVSNTIDRHVKRNSNSVVSNSNSVVSNSNSTKKSAESAQVEVLSEADIGLRRSRYRVIDASNRHSYDLITLPTISDGTVNMNSVGNSVDRSNKPKPLNLPKHVVVTSDGFLLATTRPTATTLCDPTYRPWKQKETVPVTSDSVNHSVNDSIQNTITLQRNRQKGKRCKSHSPTRSSFPLSGSILSIPKPSDDSNTTISQNTITATQFLNTISSGNSAMDSTMNTTIKTGTAHATKGLNKVNSSRTNLVGKQRMPSPLKDTIIVSKKIVPGTTTFKRHVRCKMQQNNNNQYSYDDDKEQVSSETNKENKNNSVSVPVNKKELLRKEKVKKYLATINKKIVIATPPATDCTVISLSANEKRRELMKRHRNANSNNFIADNSVGITASSNYDGVSNNFTINKMNKILYWLQNYLGIVLQTHIAAHPKTFLPDLALHPTANTNDSEGIRNLKHKVNGGEINMDPDPGRAERFAQILINSHNYKKDDIFLMKKELHKQNIVKLQPGLLTNKSLPTYLGRLTTGNAKLYEEYDLLVDRYSVQLKLHDPWWNGILLSEVVAAMCLDNRNLIKQCERVDRFGRPAKLFRNLLSSTESSVKSKAQAFHNFQICVQVLEDLLIIPTVDVTPEDLFQERERQWQLLHKVFNYYEKHKMKYQNKLLANHKRHRSISAPPRVGQYEKDEYNDDEYIEKLSEKYKDRRVTFADINENYSIRSVERNSDAESEGFIGVGTAKSSRKISSSGHRDREKHSVSPNGRSENIQNCAPSSTVYGNRLPDDKNAIPTLENKLMSQNTTSQSSDGDNKSYNDMLREIADSIKVRYMPADEGKGVVEAESLSPTEIRKLEMRKEREKARANELKRRKNNIRRSIEIPSQDRVAEDSEEKIDNSLPEGRREKLMGLHNAKRGTSGQKWFPEPITAEQAQIAENSVKPSISFIQMINVRSWLLSLNISIVDGEGGFYYHDNFKASHNASITPYKSASSPTPESPDNSTLPLSLDRLRNGELLCDLFSLLEHEVSVTFSLGDYVHRKSRIISECMENIARASYLWRSIKSPPIPAHYCHLPQKVLIGDRTILWGLMYEIMQAYCPTTRKIVVNLLTTTSSESTNRSVEIRTNLQRCLRNSSHENRAIVIEKFESQQSLLHWIESLDCTKSLVGSEKVDTLYELESLLRDGTLICSIAEKFLDIKIFPKWHKKPHTYSLCISNNEKAVEAIKMFALSQKVHTKVLNTPDIHHQVVQGNWELIISLLVDLKKCVDSTIEDEVTDETKSAREELLSKARESILSDTISTKASTIPLVGTFHPANTLRTEVIDVDNGVDLNRIYTEPKPTEYQPKLPIFVFDNTDSPSKDATLSNYHPEEYNRTESNAFDIINASLEMNAADLFPSHPFALYRNSVDHDEIHDDLLQERHHQVDLLNDPSAWMATQSEVMVVDADTATRSGKKQKDSKRVNQYSAVEMTSHDPVMESLGFKFENDNEDDFSDEKEYTQDSLAQSDPIRISDEVEEMDIVPLKPKTDVSGYGSDEERRQFADYQSRRLANALALSEDSDIIQMPPLNYKLSSPPNYNPRKPQVEETNSQNGSIDDSIDLDSTGSTQNSGDSLQQTSNSISKLPVPAIKTTSPFEQTENSSKVNESTTEIDASMMQKAVQWLVSLEIIDRLEVDERKANNQLLLDPALFQNGLSLFQLLLKLEHCSQDDIVGVNTSPKSPTQQLNNIKRCLEFLAKRNKRIPLSELFCEEELFRGNIHAIIKFVLMLKKYYPFVTRKKLNN